MPTTAPQGLYTPEFQDQVLSLLLRDSEFRNQVRSYLSPHNFDQELNKIICRELFSLADRYAEVPIEGLRALVHQRWRVAGHNGADAADAVTDMMSESFMEPDEEDFVRDQIREFTMAQAYKQAIRQGAEHVEHGQYEEFVHLVENAGRLSRNRPVRSHRLFGDMDFAVNEFIQMNRRENKIQTGFEHIDSYTNWGLRVGEMGEIIADSSVGKSLMLTNICCNNLRQGKNVLYYTLELSDVITMMRHYCCITGESIYDLQNGGSRVARMRQGIRGIEGLGEAFIVWFDATLCTVEALTRDIRRRIAEFGAVPPLIIIDYIDLMTTSYHTERRFDIADLYRRVRALAGELNTVIWTACQTHRDAVERERVGPENISEAYEKVAILDMLLCLSQTRQEKIDGYFKVFLGKSRNSPSRQTFNFRVDYGRSRVTDLGIITPTPEEERPRTRRATSRYDLSGTEASTN